jgi:uncharacterized membrane protein
MNLNIILLISLLLNPFLSALIYIPGIPVDQLSLLRAQIALNIWEIDLMENYGKPTENALNIKRNTDRVAQNLQVLSEELSPYNNAIIGSANGVKGNKNLIIGNSNTVLGSNNYIFTSNFNSLQDTKAGASGTMSNTLVSDNWVG